jgi:hypothetical protein
VRLEGPSKVYLRGSDSGRKIEQHFCLDCGSTVFWYSEHFPDLIGIAFGAFADPSMPWPPVSVWETRISLRLTYGVRLGAGRLLREQPTRGPKPGTLVEAAAEKAEIPIRSLLAAAYKLDVRTQRGQWWLPG